MKSSHVLASICIAFTAAAASGSAAQAEGWTGKASFYSHGARTASGARFQPRALTAAHRTLPFGTKLRVTNLLNNRSVTVTVNDRGPFARGRILDVSAGAADVLGFRRAGTARVHIVKVDGLQREASLQTADNARR